ncbi:putative eka-like protein, partial [Golovinomyces cichoracearum]
MSAKSNSRNEENEQPEAHPYLPRELADICLKRQQQERAWKSRLMICSSFYSCIDGTVVSFQEASDSTSSIPEFQPQTCSSHGLVHKTLGQTKKSITVATPLVTPTANKAPT